LIVQVLTTYLLWCGTLFRGPLFAGEDWHPSDYLQAHQSAIEAKLMDLRETSDLARTGDFQQRNPEQPHDSPMLVDEEVPLTEVSRNRTLSISFPNEGAPAVTFEPGVRNDDVGDDYTNSNMEMKNTNQSVEEVHQADSSESPTDRYNETNDEAKECDSIADNRDNEDDTDNIGLFGYESDEGGLPQEEPAEPEVRNPRSITRPSIDRAQLFPLTEDQINIISFPRGCNVWTDFRPSSDGEAFKCGTVSGASIDFASRQFFYELLMNDGSTEWAFGDHLAYAANSPVYYSASSFVNKEDSVHGEILMCRTAPSRFCYAVMLRTGNEPGEFRVIEDINSTQVKWRKCT
jgi:hypothetical protein